MKSSHPLSVIKPLEQFYKIYFRKIWPYKYIKWPVYIYFKGLMLTKYSRNITVSALMRLKMEAWC